MTLTLNSRADLTLENCRRVAWGKHAVAFGAEAKSAVAKARADFLQLIERPDITIYGVNTGFGHHAKNRLTPAQRKEHAQQPTFHRAVSWGEALPERVTRAIVFARLANYIEGHGAVSPHIAEAVAAMLSGPAMPTVPARGQGGAGEILSLSHLFIGLSRAHDLAEKDMNALINGSPAAAALVADAALAAKTRLELAIEVLALAAEAFNAPHGHFAPQLESYWNNPHDAWAISTLRNLMGPGNGTPRRPYQAPVSIRILPRVLGEAHRAAAVAEEVARQSLQAVSDNPVVIPERDVTGDERVVSTGGYHNSQAPAAMDALVAAYTNIAVLTGRIAAKLQDGNVSLLPAFLGYSGGKSYMGCMPMAIVGYEEEMRMLAQPTLLPGSESGGFGQDDIASPVFMAWSKMDRAGLLLEQCLATLAPIAMRVFSETKRPVPEKLGALASLIAQHYADTDGPEVFSDHLARLAEAFRARVYAAE
jgi:histidine ammonia-lyase